ncbi:porin [Paraburkholderia sp. C35]|uniref:porin n=1 Tax=Paraburkholderia sp. C35 TaxID=2126993 RepID=UPI001EF60D23|nr:porin [Paraburkholderia sp. C35]
MRLAPTFYMKAGMALTALGCASGAQAQSSVTLYGILDTSVAYIHNSGWHSTQITMTPVAAGPRWGMKGSEDLGGGLKAIFTLESGFNVGNGQMSGSNVLFGRSAYVGLSSEKLGSLTLGRQYDPVTDQVQPLTADWVFGPIAATPGDVDNYDDSARFSNAVKWTSATYQGVQLEAMYALGGLAGATGSGQTWSGALGYHTGPFSFGGGYIHIDNGNAAFASRGKSTGDSLFNSPANAGYQSARSVNIARVGGMYQANGLQVGAAYSYSSYNRDGASTFAEDEKFHNGSVYAAYTMTAPLRIGAGYSYTRALGDSSAKYHAFVVGAIYSLSKRTSVYSMAAHVHAIGEQRNGEGSLQPAQAVVGSFDIASGASTQQIVAVGITHAF